MSANATSPDGGEELAHEDATVQDEDGVVARSVKSDGDDAVSVAEGSEFDLPVEEVESEDDVVMRERDEYLDTLRRLQAEFDNYRKRMTRLERESVARATESLIERLLPVLDALDLATLHSDDDAFDSTPDRQALVQIAALARDTLAKEGLERIDAIGVPFDPNIHDAVVHLERDEGLDEQGVIVAEVLRAGYELKGKVVRPAMVQVRG